MTNTKKKTTTRVLAMTAPVALLALPLAFTASTASARSNDSSTTYMATLKPLNHASGSGTLMLQLTGSKAVITEDVKGLAGSWRVMCWPRSGPPRAR